MAEELDPDEVIALLFDECRYENIRPKAFHKILYFVDKELEREHVSVDLPIFWYMYGAVVATSETEASIEGGEDGNTVRCSITTSDIDAPEVAVRRGRRAVSRALDRYYDGGTEGLTEEMYDEAPYEVQRHYRRLDQQLETATDEKQMTLDGGKNEKRTRETLYDFVEAFPEDEFSEFSDDLSIWYRLMSAELDSDDYDPDRAQDLAEDFWRLFCLELACRENNGLSREEIARELKGVSSVEESKQRIRSDLLEMEQKKAYENAEGDETALKAGEALVIPHLDFTVAQNV
ncbi:hypothetical protein ACFPM1_12320 [Halorubrum rubrum]|uniref:DUF4065 domain-containing protein n=1 Tax=Halorubrum rubrum TaxID=1126240 RepID=A0ABD5R3Y4_9EURY|nr:hypothetical protein [Halorubrum rubrum]